MIKVLQIGCSINPGGVENIVFNYFSYMDRNIVQFDFLDIYGEGLSFAENINKLGGKIYHIANYKKHPIQAGKEMEQLIEKEKYDIIHVHMQSAANLLPILIPLKKGFLVIAHSHSSATPKGIVRKIFDTVNKCYLRKLSVEKWSCGIRAGQWMWGQSFDKRNVITNAIPYKNFQSNKVIREKIRRACEFKEEDIVLGFVGRFGDEKNTSFLIKILLSLQKISKKYKLLTVGGNGRLDEFLSEIERYGLNADHYSAGVQKCSHEWYQAMDGFLLPSFFEGFPVVAIEAQAAGLPCFLSNRITREVKISENVYFLPIKKGDEILWAQTIHKAIWKGRKDKKSISEKYNITYAAKHLEKRYQFILRKYKNEDKNYG